MKIDPKQQEAIRQTIEESSGEPVTALRGQIGDRAQALQNFVSQTLLNRTERARPSTEVAVRTVTFGPGSLNNVDTVQTPPAASPSGDTQTVRAVVDVSGVPTATTIDVLTA